MSRILRGPGLRSRSLAGLAALLAILALGLPAAADPQERLDRLEQRRARLRAEIERVEGRGDRLATRVRSLDRDRARAEAQLDWADSELAVLDGRIAEASRRLRHAQKRLMVVTDELLRRQAELVARTNLFAERAAATYKAGPAAYLTPILSSQTFGQLLDRYAYYESALDTDSELVSQIEVLRDETENRREIVEREKREIARTKLHLEQDRQKAAAVRLARARALSTVQQALGQKRELLAGARSKEAALRAIEEQLERESTRIEALLAAASSSSPAAGAEVVARGGRLLWPANGPLTSGFGYRTHPIFGDARMHTGIDIGASYGSPVIASDSGQVVYVGTMSGYGNVVVIDHGGGLATTYNHLSAFSVGNGQQVGRGSPIAAVGCTGYCTGPHLHFEVRVNGSPVDPMPYLR